MAADVVRIRLDFSNLEEADKKLTSCWMSVDTTEISNILSLKEYIKLRFLSALYATEFVLQLSGCLLPDFEKTRVLRDNDIIWARQEGGRPSVCFLGRRLWQTSDEGARRQISWMKWSMHSFRRLVSLVPLISKKVTGKRKASECIPSPESLFSKSDVPAVETVNILIQNEPSEEYGNALSQEKNSKKSKEKRRKKIKYLESSPQPSAKEFNESSGPLGIEESYHPQNTMLTSQIVPKIVFEPSTCNTINELMSPLNKDTTNKNNSEIAIVESILVTENLFEGNTVPVVEGRKRRRRHRRGKKKNILLEPLTKPTFSTCTLLEKFVEDVTPANHLHFTEDDVQSGENGNIYNNNISVGTSPYRSYTDMHVPRTVLSPSNMKYEDTCNDLLMSAKKEEQQNFSIFLANCAVGDVQKSVPSIVGKVKTEADYLLLPPLVGPPRVGDSIAYRVLELSDKFIPELSEYKEAFVVDFDSISETITAEVKVGKIQRVIKDEAGGYDTVIYDDVLNVSDPSEKKVKIHLSHMNQPKLLIANGGCTLLGTNNK